MHQLFLVGGLTSYDAPSAGGLGWMSNVAMLGVVFAIIYFVAFRPQQQERDTHEKMLATLVKDDQVVTSGGIHGRIVEVEGDVLLVEVAEKMRIRVERSAIARKAAPPQKPA
jgi:preprotein translocase subunit YajC